jgi:DNA ligase D-like protein (predicted ligase)
MPRVPSPMLATPAARLPSGPGWTYEVKWDGYRTLAVKQSSSVRLLSRNLKDATKTYPSIARSIATIPSQSALLDGEVVALDEHGQPSFQALHHGSKQSLVYYAFDLLELNGQDLTRWPLERRRAELSTLVRGTRVLLSETLPGTPEQIEAAVRGLRLEGVVAKRANSIYEAGRRSPSWIKVRFSRRQEFVIGGYKPNPINFESVLVGCHIGRSLQFASKVRAGLRAHTRGDIFSLIRNQVVVRCPFANLPNSGGSSHWGEGITAEDMTRLVWVKPSVVIEVEFVEWTRDGLLRHPSFVGIRDDIPARQVRRQEVG